MGTLGNGWVHRKSAGNYGADWRLRLAANYAGLWADSPSEVACFGAGTAKPLNGSDTYTMTFVRDDLPSFHVKYFWSVTCTGAVDRHVIPNPRNRFFLNQQSELQFGSGGSLTLYFAPRKPAEAPDGNWLPTAMGKNFALTWRSYGPDKATTSGKWFPPRLERRAV